jgi:hypothetical protein
MIMQNQCAEIVLRAERRAGQILAETPKRHGARPADAGSHDVTPSLADLGIDYKESHRWQRIELMERKAAKERRTRKPICCGNLPPQKKAKTREKVATAVGMKARTYEKAKEVHHG